MQLSSIANIRPFLLVLCVAGVLSPWQPAARAQAPVSTQATPSVQTISPAGSPIAIVPIDSSDPAKAATVTGALEVTDGMALIAANGTVTSAGKTTRVILPHRGELRVCASSSVKLAADSVTNPGETPGLLMAMDHGALEMSFATTQANLQNADVLLTPDFRILIGGPGSADVKVRLGQKGDTCVDNSGINGPYVVVSSVFEGGAYRVQPGQRVMFQHGNLHEVVDDEKEPCGCPPAVSGGNDFPLAQSEGLAPAPKAAPAPPVNKEAIRQAQDVPPLVFNSAERNPELAAQTQPPPATSSPPAAQSAAAQPPPQKKTGFFAKVGQFFRRIFGAES